MPDQLIVSLGILLMVLGILLALMVLVLPAARSGRLRRRGGAVIIVGPFPIVLGSDVNTTKVLLILTISLVSLLILLFSLRWL